MLTDINQLTLLPVRITRVDRWTEPGLLFIGDAAHVISPVGGNGINFAIIDAAEAANRLVGTADGDPGGRGGCRRRDGRVERVRRPKVDREQAFQVRVERATAQRLVAHTEPRPALPLRLIAAVPGLARWSARRSARALAVPAPDPRIVAGAAPLA